MIETLNAEQTIRVCHVPGTVDTYLSSGDSVQNLQGAPSPGTMYNVSVMVEDDGDSASSEADGGMRAERHVPPLLAPRRE